MYFKPIKLEQIQLAVNQLVMKSSSKTGNCSSAAAEGAADEEGPLHLLTHDFVSSET